jgi:16S rRNA (guanine1207-N2)-methyltransferase
MHSDPVRALFHPSVSWPDSPEAALFVNAAPCADLPEGLRPDTVQWWKQEADALSACGMASRHSLPSPAETDPYALILLAGTKNHAETRALMAHAAALLRPGGTLVCAAANDAGGTRLEKDMAALGFSPTESFPKYKSRAVTGKRGSQPLAAVAQEWMDGGARRTHPATGFLTQPGLFGWDRVDPGSVLLAACLPAGLSGSGADFGCGYGYLSHAIFNSGANVTIACADADMRAVGAAQENLAPWGDRASFLWADLAAPSFGAGKEFDWVVMNPPFHEGKKSDAAIGAAFIETAARSLRRGGTLYMVANRHLPYEAFTAKYFASHSMLKDAAGFKVIKAVR